MKIAYFGHGTRGEKCLEAVIEAGHQVIEVICLPTNNSSNGLASYAAKTRIPTVFPKDPNSPDFVEHLKELDVELFILCGYTKIIKNPVILLPKLGCINLHGGMLPKYRGGSPINWQIINGETRGGCCILFVDEGIDTGDIILQETYPIAKNDCAGDIIEKTLKIFPEMLKSVLTYFERDKVPRIKQVRDEGNYFCKRYPEDGRIDWPKMTAQQVHNTIRGLRGPGLPGAFSFYQNKKVVLWEAEMVSQCIIGAPARVAFKWDNGVVIPCSDKSLLIKKVLNPENNTMSPARDLFQTGTYLG